VGKLGSVVTVGTQRPGGEVVPLVKHGDGQRVYKAGLGAVQVPTGSSPVVATREGRDMFRIKIRGKYMPEMYGGMFALTAAWQAFKVFRCKAHCFCCEMERAVAGGWERMV
jgi:hypothetical protein